MNPRRSAISFLSCLVVLVATLVTKSAGAAGEPTRGGASLVDEAQRWLSAAAAGPVVGSEALRASTARDSSGTADRGNASPFGLAPDADALPLPFLFASPHLSLVARDWRGSMKLAGGRTLLVDDLRPTASNRLVVARLATDARLTTFVQVGAGEWRIDPAMFPNARSYSEIAGQISAGFELRLPAGLRVAGEAQYTALYRDLHYTADEVAPRIAAFVMAIDGRF